MGGLGHTHKPLWGSMLKLLLPKIDNKLSIFEADGWVQGLSLHLA